MEGKGGEEGKGKKGEGEGKVEQESSIDDPPDLPMELEESLDDPPIHNNELQPESEITFQQVTVVCRGRHQPPNTLSSSTFLIDLERPDGIRLVESTMYNTSTTPPPGNLSSLTAADPIFVLLNNLLSDN
ncbi:hypothetical protein Pcinc_024619 [Petrolisthes cinctipes]|uniref:Uncharacterized protein n=1 Tax=Petrolisthes cinctipes TaxID=88211 RepID=A0AAE1FA39_PETCI|nr:hypothetical protein Pcinc_024619 [Petrolisthes cinctipes]